MTDLLHQDFISVLNLARFLTIPSRFADHNEAPFSFHSSSTDCQLQHSEVSIYNYCYFIIPLQVLELKFQFTTIATSSFLFRFLLIYTDATTTIRCPLSAALSRRSGETRAKCSWAKSHGGKI